MTADKKNLDKAYAESRDASPGPVARPAEATYRMAPDPLRRLMVRGAALALTMVPVITWMRPGYAAPTSIDTETLRAFLDVSRFLCGDMALDGTQAGHLLQALLEEDAGFSASCRQLAAYIAANKPDPVQLQATLDTAKASFAALPRRIVTAWYVGVVGSGTQARCITYVTSLMNRAVDDHLRPPSYAYGAYGTWRIDPRSVHLPPLVAPAASTAA